MVIYSATIPLTGTSFKTRGPFHKLDMELNHWRFEWFLCRRRIARDETAPNRKKITHHAKQKVSDSVSILFASKKRFQQKEPGTVLKRLKKNGGNWICAVGVFVGNCSSILAPSHLIVQGIPKKSNRSHRTIRDLFASHKFSKEQPSMWIKFVEGPDYFLHQTELILVQILCLLTTHKCIKMSSIVGGIPAQNVVNSSWNPKLPPRKPQRTFVTLKKNKH